MAGRVVAACFVTVTILLAAAAMILYRRVWQAENIPQWVGDWIAKAMNPRC